MNVAGATDTATNTNELIVDTAANIIARDTSAGNASNQLAIASDTGAIYYDADGDYSNAVVIGQISASEVSSIASGNIVVVA